MDTSQYLSMFLEESMDNLQTLNESLLQLEQEPENIDKLNEIFRVAHTIKGMAATMGFNEMAELTHKMEDVLSKFRDGELKVTQKVVTVLFQCLDTLEQMVNNISEDNGEKIPIEGLMDELECIAKGEAFDNAGTTEDVKDEAKAEDVKKNGSQVKKSKDVFSMIQLNAYDINGLCYAQ